VRRLFIVAALAAGSASAFSQTLPVTVRSPDTRISLRIAQDSSGQLVYSVERKGETVIAASALRLRLAEGDVSSVDVRQVWPRSIDQVRKLVATKASEAHDRFNEIRIDVMPRSRALRAMQWVFRAYDDGVAFRYLVRADAGLTTLAVKSEDTEFAFGADFDCTGLNIGRVDSSHEGEFDPIRASRIREHNTYDLPLVCRTANNAFAIGEADLRDYGGLYLTGKGDGKPGVQARVSRRLDDRSLIARAAVGTNGAGSPWRVIMLGDKLGNLIESNLLGNLNPDPSFDTSWIKPG
jgi:alpha-glucosidase